MSEPPGDDTELWQDDRDSLPERSLSRDTSLEDLLERRTPLRVRLAQGLGLLLLGTVLVGLLLHAVLTAPGASVSIPSTPKPAPVALGPVLVLSNLSYGAVTLNGAPLPGSPPLVTRFRLGTNTLTLTSPPFRPRTCRIQWPTDQSPNGCDIQMNVGETYTVGGQSVSPPVIVVLSFTDADLPADLKAHALAAVTETLHAMLLRTTVPAGEYVATGGDAQGQILSQRSTSPLRADLLVTPNALGANGENFCDDLICVPMRDPATGQAIITRPTWLIDPEVSVEWQFTSNDGHVTYTTAYPSYLPKVLLLTYDPQAGWQVDQADTELIDGFALPNALEFAMCAAGANTLSTVAEPTAVEPPQYQINTVNEQGIEGCVFQLATANGTSAGNFIWRFGVLLAANSQAHARLPYLPLAPPGELSAVDA